MHDPNDDPDFDDEEVISERTVDARAAARGAARAPAIEPPEAPVAADRDTQPPEGVSARRAGSRTATSNGGNGTSHSEWRQRRAARAA